MADNWLNKLVKLLQMACRAYLTRLFGMPMRLKTIFKTTWSNI